MPKKILIVNSWPDWRSKYNLSLYEELGAHNFQFLLLSGNKTYRDFFCKNSLKCFRLAGLIDPQGPVAAILFLALLPVYWLLYLAVLLFFQKNKGVSLLLLYGVPEKIICTPPAKILGLGCVWLELPSGRPSNQKVLDRMLVAFSAWARLIVYCQRSFDRLVGLGIRQDRLHLVNPGIGISQTMHQEDIFDRMAENETKITRRKFFTIGTENALAETDKIKTLFQAVEKCRDVIPNLQVIIIGEGPEKKNLSWLARKMGIENIVWFVGEQNNLNKWLNNLDIFVFSKNAFELDDLVIMIKASAAGIPILCPAGIGLDGLVTDQVNGIWIDPTSDALAEAIIRLEQDNDLRRKMSRHARQMANEKFNIKYTIEKFKEIIDHDA